MSYLGISDVLKEDRYEEIKERKLKNLALRNLNTYWLEKRLTMKRIEGEANLEI